MGRKQSRRSEVPGVGAALVAAAALGAASGLRSMTGIALLGRHLGAARIGRSSRVLPSFANRQHHPDPVRDLLASSDAGRVLPALAAGELVADKLPGIPARTTRGSLAARVLLGAVCGWAAAGRPGARSVAAAAIGGVTAYASAHLGYHVRRTLTYDRDVPDALVAVTEDAIAVGLAAAGARVAT